MENSEGSGAKSYITNDLLIYGENICAFPHILGSPSSYMTLHPIPSEFHIYEEIFFIFYQCGKKTARGYVDTILKEFSEYFL
jgi:hypothetical protein